MSRSKWWLRAFSRDCATISLSVNSRAVSLIRRCSSVRSKSIPLLSGRSERHISAAVSPWLYSSQLGGDPRRLDAPLDLLGEPGDRQPLLGERVAVAQGHGAVLEALVVDREAKGRADLILAAVALADRAALVVLALQTAAQSGVYLACELGLSI